MRIVKGPDPWCIQIKCKDKECYTEIEIDRNDVLYGFFNGDYTEKGEPRFYVECPRCGEEIFIDKLPKIVKKAAIDKYNSQVAQAKSVILPASTLPWWWRNDRQ